MNSNRQPNNGRGISPGGYSKNTGGTPGSGMRNNTYKSSPQTGSVNRQNINGASKQGGYYRAPQSGYQKPGGVPSGNMGYNSSVSRISNQSPNQRRAEPKRVHMTAEQIEINKSNRRREKYYIKKRRSQMVRTFVSRFILFLVIFAVMFGLASAIFYMDLTHSNSGAAAYTYAIGGKTYSLDASRAVRNGRVYVNFTDIADMCGLVELGAANDIKYVIKGDGAETIRFITGSRTVYVNDVEARLTAECYYEGNALYVPADFVKAYFTGLNVTIDEFTHRVIVMRAEDEAQTSNNDEVVYKKLSFLLQSPYGLEPLSDKEENLADIPDLGFVSNLAAYEDFMNPGSTSEYLTLVNVNNKLTAEYSPQDLIDVSATRNDGREMQRLRRNAAMSLEAMFIEMRAAGIEDVSVTSAYRSYSYQESLFNSYLAQYNNDYEYVSSFSNPPGSSEHQTGLCVDMHNLPSADTAFGDTDAFRWLKENCWKFGFILRYPKDKTDVTGISYEPWHYRYVGRYHSQRMYQMNMCLEEYLDYTGN